MKTPTAAIAIFLLLMTAGCAQQGTRVQTTQPTTTSKTEVAAEQQFYTAYNIWRTRWYNMKCINYKYGKNILPAGTPVRDVRIESDSHTLGDCISFQTPHDNQLYKIGFAPQWHPGKSINDYKALMFTGQTFDELTEGMTEEEIQAIKRGSVVNGMSKKAVLVTYGYPPEHRTRSIDSSIWLYWKSKRGTFQVCFDDNDRTTNCP